MQQVVKNTILLITLSATLSCANMKGNQTGAKDTGAKDAIVQTTQEKKTIGTAIGALAILAVDKTIDVALSLLIESAIN